MEKNIENNFDSETIAAIATPSGEGAVGLIRVSGPRAVEIVSRIIKRRNPADLPLSQKQPRMLHRAIIVDPQHDNEEVDDVLIVRFVAPKSYTGEDLVEINTHGGSFLPGRVLTLLLAAGARAARPGEFTQRACLHGKMDLTQAEAVMELIQATSQRAAKLALEQLQGRLGKWIENLRSDLLETIAHLEAWLDFPEEELECALGQELLQKIEQLQGQLEQLLSTAQEGQILRDGLQLVLCGPPNSGKSSLLNYLLDKERAIVSPQAGTTRDTLAEELCLAGFPIRIIDTAGLRITEDPIEQEGVRRTHQTIKNADYYAYLIDTAHFLRQGSDMEALFSEIEEIFPPLKRASVDQAESAESSELATETSKKILLLFNKIDLCSAEQRDSLEKAWQDFQLSKKTAQGQKQPLPLLNAYHISSQTGEGITLMKNSLLKKLEARNSSLLQEEVSNIAINRRHQASLQKASGFLSQAITLLHLHQPPELLSIELHGALQAIGEILGKVDHEEVLGVIFQNFCIGK